MHASYAYLYVHIRIQGLHTDTCASLDYSVLLECSLQSSVYNQVMYLTTASQVDTVWAVRLMLLCLCRVTCKAALSAVTLSQSQPPSLLQHLLKLSHHPQDHWLAHSLPRLA